MTRPRHRKPAAPRPDLTAAQILEWADAFHARVGRWPKRKDGTRALPDTTWSAVDACLKGGSRGLQPGSSLAKLLLERRGRRHHKLLPPLTPNLILAWADDHHTRTGEWPGQHSGAVAAAPGETWSGIDCALHEGLRGLSGRDSLAQLLAARRGARNHRALPALTVEQILAWADDHHARTGEWPGQGAGPIAGSPGDNWQAVDAALRVGCRGLPGGRSLARLLRAERGVRNPAELPRLQRWEVLFWADAHFDRTGRWPTAKSGPIPEAPGESWGAVESALCAGTRGLSGGDSLARLLDRRCRPPRARRPRLTTELILQWADAHRARTGKWPTNGSGAIEGIDGAEDQTWRAVNRALRAGRHGLPGNSSLPRLLAAERGARPPLAPEQILRWADTHRARTGKWPSATSGPVVGVPDQTWAAVSAALRTGARGLPEGGSLARLLAEHRGVGNRRVRPDLTEGAVLAWADDHHCRTGRWPKHTDGAVAGAPGETWAAVETALTRGRRGLPGGDSLARLLERRRGARNKSALPRLSAAQVRAWARAHRERTGSWPQVRSGPIPEAPGETWSGVESALSKGRRGLPGGSSLFGLLNGRGAREGR